MLIQTATMKVEGEEIKGFYLVDKTQHSVSSLTGYTICDFSFKIKERLSRHSNLFDYIFLSSSLWKISDWVAPGINNGTMFWFQLQGRNRKEGECPRRFHSQVAPQPVHTPETSKLIKTQTSVLTPGPLNVAVLDRRDKRLNHRNTTLWSPPTGQLTTAVRFCRPSKKYPEGLGSDTGESASCVFYAEAEEVTRSSTLKECSIKAISNTQVRSPKWAMKSKEFKEMGAGEVQWNRLEAEPRETTEPQCK